MDAFGWIVIAIFAYGAIRGWRNISLGRGIIGRLMPDSFFNWVNQQNIGPVVVKAGISFVFSYIFAVLAILSLIFGLIFGMSKMDW